MKDDHLISDLSITLDASQIACNTTVTTFSPPPSPAFIKISLSLKDFAKLIRREPFVVDGHLANENNIIIGDTPPVSVSLKDMSFNEMRHVIDMADESNNFGF